MNEIEHYYQILGLQPGATEAEVREAYRTLVKVWHPDRFSGDPHLQEKAQEKLKEINAPYKWVLDYMAAQIEPEFEAEEEPSTHYEYSRPGAAPSPSREKWEAGSTGKCPCCGKEIHGDTQNCPSCREWIGFPFPFEVKHLFLSHEGFVYEGRRFEYDAITNLYYLNQRVTLNFIPRDDVDLKIRITSGDEIQVRKSALGKSYSPAGRHADVQKIEQAYLVLRRRSVVSRLRFYLGQLKVHGYIQYKHGYDDPGRKFQDFLYWGKIDFDSYVKIHSTGIVEKGNKRVDLRVAKRKKLLSFGTRFEYGINEKIDPNEILMSEAGFGRFDKKISFKVCWDSDIVTFIMREMAEGRIPEIDS
jgi:hypothetical protein